MLIRHWMSKPVISIEKNDSMHRASRLMKENHIRRLPVVDKDTLCGIVSDRDLKRASASDATSLDVHELLYLLSKIKISEIMTKNVITVHQNWTVEEAADVMLERKISGVPVVDDDDRLCGVVTQTDMFKATLYITGLKKRGFHLAFVLEDTPGSIMEIVNVVRQFGGRMASILSTYERAPKGYRNVYLRFYDVSRDRIDEMLKILREKAKLRYLVDHRENRRTLFDNY
ncbi:membrane protein [Desulfosarcina alkanivorans]|uniref:Membrane protein n=1 Tax=Desulfosarcina alkanivorans TaxID=571177 RepID=A0A5K7YIV4_9BACT|nr:CBS and ACT domain-containing protein [Desulfosarcina alkanivorans]BBO66681.1 membrane protein [Desulfosarcina alkanivorans]